MPRLATALCLLLACTGVLAAPPSGERQAQLRSLLFQDCGSCHGMRLTGGLGPALTPDALAGRSRELLLATVRDGRAGTPMPPWKKLLSEADIEWLVDYLMQPGAAR